MPLPAAVKKVFLGPQGLRAGWRLAVFLALWYASGYVYLLVGLFYSFSPNGFTPSDILVYEFANGVALLIICLVLARLERHGPGWFGLGWQRGSLSQFGVGSLAGFGMVSLLLLACLATGHASVGGFAEHGADLWKYLVVWGLGMLLVGLGEELLFRGYPLVALGRGIGFWPAALISSLLFGAEHLSKPMENVPDILNIVLLGLALCYSVRQTGALWFAIGFHAAFDFFALAFYGSPNTGNDGLPLEHHLLDTHIAGPAWLTGGPQGLEASWLVPPLVLVLCLLIRRLYSQERFPGA
ncbi:MAG TPA: CPBP family intramembrane glutamic endopeptidase [Gammaproteobacteria bacterium]|jgi:hypothetical protein|nr:CPBP family intramembrane glutamic endopeptidase [Gammaproteobacteria bacterium]